MTRICPLVVFSDLDGTLLDHESYSWRLAAPALKRLSQIKAPVVLASSKTASEIKILQADMGLEDWPAIVENGAGLLGDGAPGQYDLLRDLLNETWGRSRFHGFGDMSVNEVSACTGLPAEDAARAQDRQFSEPGLWRGTQAEQAQFLSDLAARGIAARSGGRFLTLSFGKTKADQMGALLARFQPQHSIALGDAPNDLEMLQAADIGVIVANPHRPALPPLPGEDTGRIFRTKEAGPLGWNTAILALLDRLGH